MRLLLLLLIVLLSLCAQPQIEEGKIRVVDDTGSVVVLSEPAKRIVSLAPSNTEILFAIGAGDQVVGVTDYCNYPPEVLKLKEEGKLKSVGGYTTVNVERVVALKPDLVVAAYGNGLETIETLRRFGLNVVAFNPRNISDVMRSILILGKLTGHEEEAEKLVEDMKRKLKYVEECVKGKRRLKVVHILWHDPVYVSGAQTFIDEVIRIAGGVNAFNFSGWRVVSVEDIIAADPDVIIVNSGSGMGGGRNVIYEWVVSDPLLSDVKAVREGRVYVIDADIISRPSYRLAEAAMIVSKWLHGCELGEI
ncbi:MAG: ABC transporter substrate-binding protein [Archaeoglobaceae archaeon]